MSTIADAMSSRGFDHTDQFGYLFDAYVFYPFFNGLNQIAQKSSIVSWISPGVGITVGTAEFIKMVGAAIEAGIKGICNVAVGLTTFNTSLLATGSVQLLTVPAFAVVSIPLGVYSALVTTKEMICEPEEASKREAKIYQKSIAEFSARQVK